MFASQHEKHNWFASKFTLKKNIMKWNENFLTRFRGNEREV